MDEGLSSLIQSPLEPDVMPPEGYELMDIDMDRMARPPPLRDGVPLSFSYLDHRWPGCVVTESTAVDVNAGLLVWWRHVEPGEDENAFPQGSGQPWHWGGCWNLADIVGIRYTTMFGDPGMEFLAGSQKQYVPFSKTGFDARVIGLFLNPLTVTFGLSICMAWQLYWVFPQDNGFINMSRGADSDGIDGAIVLAVVCILSTLASLWWLGMFSYFTGKKYKLMHLTPWTSSRWWWQKGFTELTLEVFLGLCVAIIVVCGMAKRWQYGEECYDLNSNAGRRLATTCIKQDGLDQTCGVAGCQCDEVSDLLCLEPPSPKQYCVKVILPLCAMADSDIRVSGMHGYLHHLFTATQVLAVACGLVWIITSAAMLLTWMGHKMRNSQVVEIPQKPDVSYHRFQVIFASQPEEPIVFNVSSSEDPDAVACILAGEEL